MTKTELKRYLINQFEYSYERKRSLENWLIRFVCNEQGCPPQGKLTDIITSGCISGCVGSLIYISDCIKFYTKYEEQIWNLICEVRENTGQTLGQFLDSFSCSLEDNDSLKVYLSWFAIEQTAYKLLNTLESN